MLPLNDLCECVWHAVLQHATPGEVAETLRRLTVCTATQCYEGDADAFGVQPPPRVATDASWMMVLVCAACAARMLMQQRRSVSECKS